MMKRLFPFVFVLATASWCAAQPAETVPQEVLDRIADDDPNPLPRYLTPAERLLPLPVRSAEDRLRLAPPTGTVYTPAEYAFNEGLLIRWGSYNDVLTAMTVGVTTGDPDAIVYILVTGASQQSSATSTLSSAGADLSQVGFITYTSDTVWIRDYGPRFIFEDDLRAIVDHDYNRPRPLDDAFPPFLGSLWGEPVYDLPLTHGGGNFHLFGTGDAFMSDLILDENPGLSEQDVKDYFAEYLNVDLTIYDRFPYSFDSTGHIDMWFFPVADDEVIIGQYSSSTGQPYTITEGAVADLTSRGYTVYRTPGWNSGGTHYTYTNAVVLNDLVFISQFGGSYVSQDNQAKAVFETAFPDHQVIQVNCSSIIHAAGALHCIVMHVPAYTGAIPIVRVLTPDGGEEWTIGQQYDITWSAHDDVGVTGVDLYYSTDGGVTFPHEIALDEPDDGVFSWTIPSTSSTQCRVKVIAHDADANSGEDISDGDFVITPYGPQVVYSFPLDSDPGWTTEAEWAFGKPTGAGGEHGGPDPTAGYTGPNVYGYNLFGDYTEDMPEHHLTSTALDCTGWEAVHLKFWRWLGVEQPQYDHAYLRVSNNGVDWTTVWQNDATVSDVSWVLQEFDISAVADDQPTVYLRWTMGPTDDLWQYCGWNIDDIEIWGVPIDLDCNDNGTLDYEDITGGTSDDCNGNGVPDECEIDENSSAPGGPFFCVSNCNPDCNNNGIPDECDVAGEASADCNNNGVPDECEIDENSSAPGGPFFCVTNCDPDCNNNGIPDECDVAGETSADCNNNGVPDECDASGGTSPDTNGNGIPDECEVVPAIPPPPPDDVAKNRYVSFVPGNEGLRVAWHIEIAACDYFPGSVGTEGWVGPPEENDIARMVEEPVFRDTWPGVAHLGDCAIVPAAAYEIRATVNGVAFTEPYEVATIAQPAPKYWGDVVGFYDVTEWAPPNGVVNMDDVMAAVQKFQQLANAPPLTWVDVDEEVPNGVLNMTDILRIVQGFKGEAYPFSAPAGCP